MPLIYHVELQRAVNIAKEMMLHLVLFGLGLRGTCLPSMHNFLFISSAAIALDMTTMEMDNFKRPLDQWVAYCQHYV